MVQWLRLCASHSIRHPEGSCRACVAPERGQVWSRVGPRPDAEGWATVAATAAWRARMLSEEGWVTGDQSLRCCWGEGGRLVALGFPQVLVNLRWPSQGPTWVWPPKDQETASVAMMYSAWTTGHLWSKCTACHNYNESNRIAENHQKSMQKWVHHAVSWSPCIWTLQSNSQNSETTRTCTCVHKPIAHSGRESGKHSLTII